MKRSIWISSILYRIECNIVYTTGKEHSITKVQKKYPRESINGFYPTCNSIDDLLKRVAVNLAIDADCTSATLTDVKVFCVMDTTKQGIKKVKHITTVKNIFESDKVFLKF